MTLQSDNGTLVYHRERAEGVRPELRAFLDDWEVNGLFPIEVAWMGGLRSGAAAEAAQLSAYLAGDSRARTLAETAHGRGAGLDIQPLGFWYRRLRVSEADYTLFRQVAEFVKTRHPSLVSGLYWTAAFPPTQTNPYGGDLGHYEVRGWQRLPMPSPGAPT